MKCNHGDSRHGTPETKALMAEWDPKETVKLKAARNLGAWSAPKEKTPAKPVYSELTPPHGEVTKSVSFFLNPFLSFLLYACRILSLGSLS